MRTVWRTTATIALAGGVFWGAPAAAGAPQLTVSGNLVPGGLVTISGDGCVSTDSNGNPSAGSPVEVAITHTSPYEVLAYTTLAADADGNWTAQLEIPMTANPGAASEVVGNCTRFLGTEVNQGFQYTPYQFTMGGEQSTPRPTPSTTPSTTVNPTTSAPPSVGDSGGDRPPAAIPQAPGADPVARTPALTG